MASFGLRQLFKLSEEESIKKFQQYEIIPRTTVCRKKHLMTLKYDISFKWKCQKRSCRESFSIRKNTWLDGSYLSFNATLTFIYCWTKEYTSINFCIEELRL